MVGCLLNLSVLAYERKSSSVLGMLCLLCEVVVLALESMVILVSAGR